jgi:hypothetical protein
MGPKKAFIEEEPVVDEEDLEYNEEEDEEEEEDEDFMDMGGMMANFLCTEGGDNIATVLSNIGQKLDTQNKILVKILTQLSKKDKET